MPSELRLSAEERANIVYLAAGGDFDDSPDMIRLARAILALEARVGGLFIDGETFTDRLKRSTWLNERLDALMEAVSAPEAETYASPNRGIATKWRTPAAAAPGEPEPEWRCQSCRDPLTHDPIGTAGICCKCVGAAPVGAEDEGGDKNERGNETQGSDEATPSAATDVSVATEPNEIRCSSCGARYPKEPPHGWCCDDCGGSCPACHEGRNGTLTLSRSPAPEPAAVPPLNPSTGRPWTEREWAAHNGDNHWPPEQSQRSAPALMASTPPVQKGMDRDAAVQLTLAYDIARMEHAAAHSDETLERVRTLLNQIVDGLTSTPQPTKCEACSRPPRYYEEPHTYTPPTASLKSKALVLCQHCGYPAPVSAREEQERIEASIDGVETQKPEMRGFVTIEVPHASADSLHDRVGERCVLIISRSPSTQLGDTP